MFDQLFTVILDRQENPRPGSYTNQLLEQGVDKILQKIGEEAVEVILAAKGHGSSLVMLNPAPPAGIWTVFNRDIWRAFLRYRFRWNYRRRPFRIGLKAASRGIFNLLPQDEARESYAKLVYESGQAIHEIGEWFLDRGKATMAIKLAPESRALLPKS